MSVERTDPGEPTTSDGVMYCSGILGYEVGESSAGAAARPAGGLRADYGFVATIDREIRRDPERYVGYGITDSWDEIVETLQGAPVSTDIELGAHMRVFESMRGLGTSDGCCDLAHGGVISLRTTVHAQMSEITELQSADHRRQRGRFYDLLETDRRRHTTERDDSTSGTGHHTGGVVAGDSIYWECADITGAGALTWWNSHVMTVTHDVAYSMTWVDLKKKMTDKYCPRNEMKKLEAELWNLKNVPEEADKIERGTGNVNNINNQKGTGSGQKPTCFECGAQGHFKKECPRMKNNKGNRGNQAGNDRAPAKVYVVGNAGANPDNVCSYQDKGFIDLGLALADAPVQFLGHVIDSEGIHVDPAKIESIKYWTSPKSPTEIHQFLGLAGYYRRFIEGFSKIAKPMTKLPKRCATKSLALPEESERLSSNSVTLQRRGKANVVADALSRKERETTTKAYIPEWKWDIITMNFCSKLPIRHLKAMITFGRFGYKFGYEYAYHPQTDGQSERTIQTLEDMLRACAIDFGKGWVNHLPLVEFSYNNSYHASIKAAPFEALYGRKCRSPVCWTEVGEAQILGPELIQETTEKIHSDQAKDASRFVMTEELR
ncbi:putative reverse transcriptase domain-containing protein [Tanacetum coccineum]|uniref:Reverse transcriptase domain-containing protein n=1 Tax=Tanacetum coccineum TaxID=301880 RepID=A0ABQ5EZ65_9ASTR